jgi:hypothetical protein
MNMNMSINTNMKTNDNATMSSKMTAGAMTTSGNDNNGNAIIKNITEYHTARSLAAKAQEVFDKNLKPISPPNVASANAQIEKDLSQLKTAIDNKTMDIMKIVHVQIHPILITTYNLPLK